MGLDNIKLSTETSIGTSNHMGFGAPPYIHRDELIKHLGEPQLINGEPNWNCELENRTFFTIYQYGGTHRLPDGRESWKIGTYSEYDYEDVKTELIKYYPNYR